MKKILTLLFLLSSVFSYGQNLVPNPSFEIHDSCPYNPSQIQFATGWSSYGNTPDYYNACSTDYMSVPNNFLGYKPAENGNAYSGLQFYNIADTTYREFLGITLDSSLQIGQRYFVTAYFSLAADISYCIAINKLCINFSTTTYSENSPPPLNNFAQIVSDSIIKDTIGWFQLKGSFIADSAYTQIIIGNFFNSYLTDTFLYYDINNSTSAYYMVDMVCVSRDSNSCYSSQTEGIQTINKGNNDIKIIYNDDNITITNLASNIINANIKISDIVGRILFTNQVYIDDIDKIPIVNLSPSIYFLTIQTKNNNQTIKFIKK